LTITGGYKPVPIVYLSQRAVIRAVLHGSAPEYNYDRPGLALQYRPFPGVSRSGVRQIVHQIWAIDRHSASVYCTSAIP
jgi:hypothetical protein